MSHKGKWEDDFIEEIGLKDIIKNDYEKIGGEIKKSGKKLEIYLNRLKRTWIE